jgi:hypothetical protein
MTSTSDLQQQALTFYETREGSLLSSDNTLSLIVHDSSNSPSWLVSGIIQQSLSENNECYLSPQSPTLEKQASPSFLCSFTSPEHSYLKHFQKTITKNKQLFTFKSFLSDSSAQIEKWDSLIFEQIKSKNSPNPIVIIEHPEILLSIIPGLTIDKLLSQIHEIQKISTLYIVTSTSLSLSYSQLLPILLHHSTLIISLTSLSTGRADDISGILSITSGPQKSLLNVSDRQYSYLVTTNNVKLYFK